MMPGIRTRLFLLLSIPIWLGVNPTVASAGTIRVPLDYLDPGEHVVLVRAVDHAGNIGTGRVGFRVR